MSSEYEIIRGTVNGKEKYCRIPIKSKAAEVLTQSEIYEVSAPKILDMPREEAIRIIDAIIADWEYWLKRANELYLYFAAKEPDCDKREEIKN